LPIQLPQLAFSPPRRSTLIEPAPPIAVRQQHLRLRPCWQPC
jgi:hypothetical protein